MPDAKVIKCPACDSPALLRGTEITSTQPVLRDDWLYWEVVYLPKEFRCIACSLALKGHALLQGAGLGGQFAVEQSADPTEYYSPGEEYFEEYNNM